MQPMMTVVLGAGTIERALPPVESSSSALVLTLLVAVGVEELIFATHQVADRVLEETKRWVGLEKAS